MDSVVMNDTRIQTFFKRTYLYLALGILVTAVISLGMAILAPNLVIAIASQPFFFLGAFLIQLLLVVVIARSLDGSGVKSGAMYLVFTAVEGVLISPIFFIYSLQTIVMAFISAVSLFGIMAIIGYTTKIDTSKWRGILFATTIALIVVSLINLFVINSVVSLVISWITIIIFSGWSMYDSQRLKEMALSTDMSSLNGVAVSGALNFYLDILNMFLSLLRIFGSR